MDTDTSVAHNRVVKARLASPEPAAISESALFMRQTTKEEHKAADVATEAGVSRGEIRKRRIDVFAANPVKRT